jgi:glutamine synthetase
VLLTAGLEGIEKGYECPPPVEENIYELTAEERKARGIESLPEDLGHAIEVCESSALVRKALGDHIFEKLIENKKIEWQQYRAQVHGYELDRYLSIL